MTEDKLRRVILRPYRRGLGLPYFVLETYDTHGRDWRGCTTIGYRLTQWQDGKGIVLFAGEDFHGSPLHADDSDMTVASLMTFLTLRPGDTDKDYFDAYSAKQLEFISQHAEILSSEVDYRFVYSRM